MVDSFDDLHRSMTVQQPWCMQSHDVLGAQEFGRFSAETRGAIQILLGA
jgi:hypothetical protein